MVILSKTFRPGTGALKGYIVHAQAAGISLARLGTSRYNSCIMTKALILASSSRYRRELLDRLGIAYTCESPDIDESSLPGETPQDTAMRLSEMKARAIWDKHPGAVVIGSDQVADLNGVKLGKPHTHENAVRQLKSMQGHDVVFTTALCVIDAEGRAERVKSQTTIRMRTLSDEAIEAYVEREKPFDCAGAAKIERLGIALMESVKSDDPTSLIGLPLMALTTLLTRAGVEVLPGLDEADAVGDHREGTLGGLCGILLTQGAGGGVARVDHGGKRVLLVFGVALDGFDQVRDQVVAALQLRVDVLPGIIDAIALGDHVVVDAGDGAGDHNDNNDTDDDGKHDVSVSNGSGVLRLPLLV